MQGIKWGKSSSSQKLHDADNRQAGAKNLQL